jgi:hypothetical protein
MSRPPLADLPEPAVVLDLAVEDVPAVLVKLAALQTALAARLASIPPPAPAGADGLLNFTEAVALLGRSASWMRKRGRTLPGFSQPTGPGGRVRWSRAALLAWRDGGC